jgi:hypothetical protein
VHPAQKIAVVVTAADHSLTNVVARLFGDLWPQLAALRIPKALNSQETASLELTRYTGTYGGGPISVSISRSRRSTLELKAHRREHGRLAREPFASAALVAARDEVFFTVPSHTDQFPFVQFIHPSPQGFRFLWNGRCVWPLTPSRGPGRRGNAAS